MQVTQSDRDSPDRGRLSPRCRNKMSPHRLYAYTTITPTAMQMAKAITCKGGVWVEEQGGRGRVCVCGGGGRDFSPERATLCRTPAFDRGHQSTETLTTATPGGRALLVPL